MAANKRKTDNSSNSLVEMSHREQLLGESQWPAAGSEGKLWGCVEVLNFNHFCLSAKRPKKTHKKGGAAATSWTLSLTLQLVTTSVSQTVATARTFRLSWSLQPCRSELPDRARLIRNVSHSQRVDFTCPFRKNAFLLVQGAAPNRIQSRSRVEKSRDRCR